MRPTTITLTGSGAGVTTSAPVRVNWRGEDVSLAFDTDGSTTAFTAQYTLTPPDGYASATAWADGAVWFASGISAATADEAAVITGSVQGVRLSASAAGTDTGVLTIAQHG